jgi:two-component system CheB/CheR fusion protein
VEGTSAAWLECVRTGQDWDREHRFKGADGGWHPILARGVPVRDEEGKITAWAGINLDIRRLKDAERELRAADRRKDEFLATLAHELRSPLAPISNGLEILKLARSPEEVEQVRIMMERQQQQMVRLVDDLMDVSRISRGRIELRREPVDLAKVVLRALEACRPLLDQGGRELAVDMPREPVFVHADVTRLAQVFANLLSNAAKYTNPGGRISLQVAPAGERVEVEVADDGVGIPPEKLDEVFDLFVQVDSSLEKSHGGLGIGLTIVKRLVEMHGGDVSAFSQGPGTGSRFRVRLPAMSARPPAAPGQRAEDGGSRGGLRIMVVDDNHDSALSLVMLLELGGHDARAAHDGFEAIALAETFDPHLVLLDIGLPRLNGYETCQRLRERAVGRPLKIVALTGWGQAHDRQRSLEAGFDQHLVKPLDPAVLKTLIAEIQGG